MHEHNKKQQEQRLCFLSSLSNNPSYYVNQWVHTKIKTSSTSIENVLPVLPLRTSERVNVKDLIQTTTFASYILLTMLPHNTLLLKWANIIHLIWISLFLPFQSHGWIEVCIVILLGCSYVLSFCVISYVLACYLCPKHTHHTLNIKRETLTITDIVH